MYTYSIQAVCLIKQQFMKAKNVSFGFLESYEKTLFKEQLKNRSVKICFFSFSNQNSIISDFHVPGLDFVDIYENEEQEHTIARRIVLHDSDHTSLKIENVECYRYWFELFKKEEVCIATIRRKGIG